MISAVLPPAQGLLEQVARAVLELAELVPQARALAVLALRLQVLELVASEALALPVLASARHPLRPAPAYPFQAQPALAWGLHRASAALE
jgi:hypothetical protein